MRSWTSSPRRIRQVIRRRGSSLHCRVVASAPSASVAELWLTSVWGTGAVQLRLYHGAASSLYGGWEAEAKGKEVTINTGLPNKALIDRMRSGL